MNLAIIVPLLVVSATALAGLVGYLIDRSAESEEELDAVSGGFSEVDKRIKVTKNS